MIRPEWEPLTTAEAVMRAFSDGKKVQLLFRHSDRWIWQKVSTDECPIGLVRIELKRGYKYRARIEGGAE